VASKDKEKRPIIVVRKKVVHGGGHHGGSWKVAYADFVTAMMAFFLVMWIVGMDDQTKQAIEGYFSNPVGYKKGYSSGSSPIASGASPGVVRQTPVKLVVRNFEKRAFEDVAARLEAKLDSAQALIGRNAKVEVLITEQGLRIELIEGGTGETFFSSASAEVKAGARLALEIIAFELRGLPNALVIEGHTDAVPYRAGSATGYSNWELSSDRANAARRVLEAAGIDPARVDAVRGLADRKLRNAANPTDPANRRISILLPYSSDEPPPPTPATGEVVGVREG
jgi:chemotaxis protein MotB